MEELKEGWRRVKLGEVAEILNGYAFKANDFKEIGVPVIKIKNITPPKVKLEDVQFVSEELYNEKIKYSLIYNDILISMTGSHASQPNSIVGRVARIKEMNKKVLLNQRVGKIYPKNEECNQSFLYYYLSQDFIKFELAASAGGSASQANINPNQIKELEIPFPPSETQEKIASILSALDDKIEINNEMNKTLEEMAQTLFKRWFIDFDFPNENGEPYRSSGGKMVDSELGEIPEGWEVGNFEDIGIIASGGTPSKSNEEYYTKNGIPWITPKDLSLNKNKFITKGSLDITEKGLAKSSTKLLPKGTVLFSSRAPIGYLAIAEVDVTTNQGFKSIIPNNSENTEFIYQLLKEITPHIESIAGGSTFKEISSQGMKGINITIPSNLILKKYFEITDSFNRKIQNLEKEIQSLTEIRDTLLPKLMSGEIEV